MYQVSQYNKEGNLMATYKSVAEAYRKTGIDRNSIHSVLRGSTRTAGGYFWARADEEFTIPEKKMKPKIKAPKPKKEAKNGSLISPSGIKFCWEMSEKNVIILSTTFSLHLSNYGMLSSFFLDKLDKELHSRGRKLVSQCYQEQLIGKSILISEVAQSPSTSAKYNLELYFSPSPELSKYVIIEELTTRIDGLLEEIMFENDLLFKKIRK